MNARLAKETRSLMPTLGVTLAAIVALCWLLDGHNAAGIVVLVFPGCCAVMGALAFGSEFQSRTMPLLLAQPVPRQRIWFEKMLVLGIALALSCGILLASLRLLIHGEGLPEDFRVMTGWALLVVFCAFCTAPGFTLIIKNTIGGTALAVTMPMMVCGVLSSLAWLGGKALGKPDPLFSAAFDAHPYRFAISGAAIYCAFCYWWGRRGFMRFEAIESQGRELALPEKLGSSIEPLVQKFLPPYSGPLTALVRKELLLQRASFMIAGVMFVLTIFAWLFFKVHPSEFSGAGIALSISIAAILVPVITGIATVAEERNWGTTGWQLTLPISPFKQWLVKMIVAWLTCLLLGVALPLGLARAGYAIENQPFTLLSNDDFRLMLWSVIYVSVFTMMLYGSSASANTQRATLFGFGLVIATGTIIGLVQFGIDRYMHPMLFNGFINPVRVYDWWVGHALNDPQRTARAAHVIMSVLGVMIGVLLAMLYVFSYVNFRNGDLNAGRCRRQMALFFAVFIAFTALVIAFNVVMVQGQEDFQAPISYPHAHPQPAAPRPMPPR